MKKLKQNRPKVKVQASNTALNASTLPSVSYKAEKVPALESQSALQLMPGAFAASVPMESGVSQIKSSGTKCHKKEKKTMSKKATQGGQSPHMNSARRTRSKRTGGAGGSNLSAAAAKHSKPPKGHNRGLNDESFADFEVSIAKSILGKLDLRFYCQSMNDGHKAEREFECDDDIQRMQAKLAAYRCSWTKPDGLSSTRKSSMPQAMFGALVSPVDGKTIGVRVVFVLEDSIPAEVETTAILRKLGVPSGSELVQYSNSEVYALITEVFAIDGLDRSQYESVFGSSDMPSICSDMCASVYKDFGDITFPPMTLSEFGNVLHALKFFDEEVALATLRRIYSNRCQA